VIEPTLDALLVMESQIHEGGANGYPGIYPTDEEGRQKRRDEVRASSGQSNSAFDKVLPWGDRYAIRGYL
jgi:hypothetical protein